ncbi:hypothetical protein Bbelb_050880 [Branchiostoma belcheri]|nr:hypothetical protein Bbelb_050880 [Branchiostoma belcheri]
MKGARQRKVALPEKIVKMGGVCEEVEKFGSLYREQENLDALKHQIQFNKKVLKSEGIKELLQMTVTRQGTGRHIFSSEEKANHLIEVISINRNGSKYRHRQREARQDADGY